MSDDIKFTISELNAIRGCLEGTLKNLAISLPSLASDPVVKAIHSAANKLAAYLDEEVP